MEKSPNNPPRVILSSEEKATISKSVLLEKWEQQEEYIDHLLSKSGDNSNEKLKLQQQEATRRENVLLMRLATKEQEMQELLSQIQELKEKQAPSTAQLQSMLIDPAVNLLFEKMKTELTETKDRLEQAQNDLSAWKFTPDSTTGKKLMGKCRMLIQENQELGKQLSQGRIAQLEAELALQKKYSDELKESQDEMNDFVIQLDEEVEGMQATICALQDELKTTKTRCSELEQENYKDLQNGCERDLNEQNDLLSHKPLNEEEHYVNRTTRVKCEMDDMDDQMNDDEKRAIPPPPLLTDKNGRAEEEKERTVHSNGDSNMTDESEELPMETEPNITHASKASTNIHSEELSSQHHDNDEHAARPNHVTVIRGTDDNFISPTKGLTKTSFSINDLLAPGTEDLRKDADVSMEIGGPENGVVSTTSVLNGDIDDDAI